MRRIPYVLALTAYACGAPSAKTPLPPRAPHAATTASPSQPPPQRGFVVAGAEVVNLSDGTVFAHGLVGRKQAATFVPSVSGNEGETLVVDTPSGLVGFDLRARRETFRVTEGCFDAWLRSGELLCASRAGPLIALAIPSGARLRTWSEPELDDAIPDAAERIGDEWVVRTSRGVYLLHRGGAVAKVELSNRFVTDLVATADTFCVLHTDASIARWRGGVGCYSAEGAPLWNRTWSDAVGPLRVGGPLLIVRTHNAGMQVGYDVVVAKTGKAPEPPLDRLSGTVRLLSDARGVPQAALRFWVGSGLSFEPLAPSTGRTRDLHISAPDPWKTCAAYDGRWLVVSTPAAHPSVDAIDVTKSGDDVEWSTALPAPIGGQAGDYDDIQVEIVGPLVVVRGRLGAWAQAPFSHVLDRATGDILRSLPSKRFEVPSPKVTWPAR